MSTSLLLEKQAATELEPKNSSAANNESLQCSCGLAHMATHNALCVACSKGLSQGNS